MLVSMSEDDFADWRLRQQYKRTLSNATLHKFARGSSSEGSLQAVLGREGGSEPGRLTPLVDGMTSAFKGKWGVTPVNATPVSVMPVSVTASSADSDNGIPVDNGAPYRSRFSFP